MNRTHLYPRTRQGLRIAEARSWRIGAESGSLVEHRAGTGPRVLAQPGELTRAVLLRGDEVPRALRGGVWHAPLIGGDFAEHEAVALLAGDDVRVVVGVRTFAQNPDGVDEDSSRRAAGLPAVLDALGLTLERAEAAEVGLVASARTATLGPVADALARQLRLHLVLLIVAVVAIVLVFGASSYDRAGYLVPAVVAVTALMALATQQWLASVAFLKAVGRPTAPTLRIGARDVVLASPGSETWAPGPAAGGIVSCTAADDVIFFVSAGNEPLLVIQEAADWYAADGGSALEDACRRTGIKHDRLHRRLGPDAEQMAAFDAQLGRSLRTLASAGGRLRPRDQMSAVDRGDGTILAPLLTTVGLVLMVVLVGLDPNKDRGPLEWAVGGLAAVGVAMMGVRQVRLRSWDRSTPEDAVRVEVLTR